MHEKRVAALRDKLGALDVAGLLVTQLDNVRYLSGFTGTAGVVLVTAQEAFFLTDSRYTTQAKAQVAGLFTVLEHRKILERMIELIGSLGIARVGFEAPSLSYAQYRQLQQALSSQELLPCEKVVEELRAVKDEGEVQQIRGAIALVAEALRAVRPRLRPGVEERAVALDFEVCLRRMGAEKIAFDVIVASGARSALPHGVASAKAIQSGDLVVFDCGATFQGYNSDLTRTWMIEKSDPRQEEIYRIVAEAQRKAIEAIKPGVCTHEVDAVARTVIQEAGYGEFFGHGTGHGVGLALHEEPSLSRDEGPALKEGMVVTVEPGIYLPDWGGVRIEDMVLVTREGHEVLTESIPRDLEVIVPLP
ncbi:MAG: aminopeptidase P family protein [Candidatus Tectomicrobia bacterium]|uniref:Aminopeptidase P family protein n=1 Tax=Tectimicrobiota bacterium TaxID=2528274 RepID=A0A932CLN8_UNCTE|nr:aminopeptidase P family protein [Candidatus Tectomicrobia bacterium]